MTALIILAAGASTRLGKPKQNLVFQRQTLLEKAIETGLASNCHPVNKPSNPTQQFEGRS
jgi:molybdenum cofactor cytidylyltransferase